MNEMKLVKMLTDFFEEDFMTGDITSQSIFHESDEGTGAFVAKEDGIFCGKSIIKTSFQLLNKNISIDIHVNDGEEIKKGETIATVQGSVLSMLAGERVILNLIQRMSGIATITSQAVAMIEEGSKTKICDTRKTTPGLRMLEKYAVKCGGASNHRFGLYDAVMIKDNHISAAGGIERAVRLVKENIGHAVKIEVETETLQDVLEAVRAGADIIMFDNRVPEEIVQFKKHVPPSIITEASGGITLKNINEYSKTNVDYISLGFITHSVKSLDISFYIHTQLY